MILDFATGPFVPESLATAAATNSGPIFELQTGATDSACVLEIVVHINNNNSSGTAMSVGLGVPAAAGVGVRGFTPAGENVSDTTVLPGLALYNCWSSRPTVPTAFLRRMVVNIATGQGAVNGPRLPLRFLFPNGLRIAASHSLVLWQISSPNALLSYVDVVVTVSD